MQSHARAPDTEAREADEILGATKHALQNKVAALSAIRSETSARGASALEVRDELEINLQCLGQEVEVMRNRLLTETDAGRQRMQKAQFECEELRQQEESALNRV